MKKNVLLLGAAMLALGACTNNEESMLTNDEYRIPVSLSVSTETVLTRAEDGIYTASSGFDGGEQLEVYLNNAERHATYTVVQDKSTLEGGPLYYPATDDVTLYAVYPASSTTTHTVAYDQSGDAAYKASDLMFASKSVAQADKKQTQNLSLEHKMVKLKLTVVKKAGVNQVTEVRMKNVKRQSAVTLAATGLTLGTPATASGDSYGDEIIISSGEAANASEVTYTYAAVFPAQAWEGTDFVTVTADGKTATYKLTRSDFAGGTENSLTLNLNAAALGSTVSITDWTASSEATVTAGVNTVREAVDLGLPSSLKWANMNVGAYSEAEYGGYFMWGDLIGYSENPADGHRFFMGNYKFLDEAYTSVEGVMSKYNDDDKLTTLESADDAAYTLWGIEWRMPTKGDWQELIDNTSKEYVQNYNGSGVAGAKFIGSNGNYIFLPLGGIRQNDKIVVKDSYGYYWSSTLCIEGDNNDFYWDAYYLPFWTSGTNISFYSNYMPYQQRYYGCNIRAVQP